MTVSAATFNVPFEGLLDRTAFLYDRMAQLVPGFGMSLAGGSFVHVVPPIAVMSDRFGFINGPFAQQQSAVDVAGALLIPLPRPPSGKIVEIQAFVQGSSGHGALPATMPDLALYRQDILLAGSGTLVASAADLSANAAAYETGHQIFFTPNHTLVGQEFYWLSFRGETGANSQVGLLLAGFAVYWGAP